MYRALIRWIISIKRPTNGPGFTDVILFYSGHQQVSGNNVAI